MATAKFVAILVFSLTIGAFGQNYYENHNKLSSKQVIKSVVSDGNKLERQSVPQETITKKEYIRFDFTPSIIERKRLEKKNNSQNS